MALIDDGTGTYTLGPTGEKRYAQCTEARICGEILYKMDPSTGILEICADPETIAVIIEKAGGLPCKELILPDPMGQGLHFFDVTETKPVLNQAGECFLQISREEDSSNLQGAPIIDIEARVVEDEEDSNSESKQLRNISIGIVVLILFIIFVMTR